MRDKALLITGGAGFNDNGRAVSSRRLDGGHVRSAVERSSGNGTRGNSSEGYVLITGGAGFVGVNLAARLLESGRRVVVFDNLSRAGVERNLGWLRTEYGDRAEAVIADIRDAGAVENAVRGAKMVYHFAAQVAVTTSLEAPREDFETNVLGTLNVLEAARRSPRPPAVLFLSTNKVYGDLGGVELRQEGSRWMPSSPTKRRGINETQPLSFHTPYGCSKGAADQYVLDYGRVFDFSTVVFRMSCIYGPHQCGTDDQGWVAHFLLQVMQGKPITLYGDGRQVRDVLYVEDLLDAFQLAEERIDELAGEVFNLGGGPINAVSLVEFIDKLGAALGGRIEVEFGPWREGDQKYYVSNPEKFEHYTGWRPRVSVEDGLSRLHQWFAEERVIEREPIASKRP